MTRARQIQDGVRVPQPKLLAYLVMVACQMMGNQWRRDSLQGQMYL